ncbi:MAG: hypothetical protein M3065_07470 [Actinomycetota bacterium]|nr:hypothetical protein [Actinomycetota bacterium]
MTKLRQAVERAREHEGWPPDGDFGVNTLMQHFSPSRAGSLRSLMEAMNDKAADKRPWAVILCRFKGDAPDHDVEEPIKTFFEQAFTPGTGGLVDYWRDVSLGAIDIAGSRVFDWVEVAIPRSAAGGYAGTMPPGPGRAGLFNAAITAFEAKNPGALRSFYGQIAVYSQDWAKEGSFADADHIDGGALDSGEHGGKVSLTPPLHDNTPAPYDGSIPAHEMGHGFGMYHDVSADLKQEYADPCCIMSQNGTFVDPTFRVAFGPAVCLPHLVQRDWMYERRVYYDSGAWLNQPDGITLPLAPNTRPGVRANLGIRLAYADGDTSWDYYLDYVIPTEWNRGVPGAPYVFVRRIVPTDVRPVYLGALPIPPRGATTEFFEPSGRVAFQVMLFDEKGPSVSVTARRA